MSRGGEKGGERRKRKRKIERGNESDRKKEKKSTQVIIREFLKGGRETRFHCCYCSSENEKIGQRKIKKNEMK